MRLYYTLKDGKVDKVSINPALLIGKIYYKDLTVDNTFSFSTHKPY